VFFSIKGGVGRSTALAATAWRLAQAGKRILVLDLDLESPGLSSSLLSPDRQPVYGITDSAWSMLLTGTVTQRAGFVPPDSTMAYG
jgi:Mrp family chromosome partitioning ATPase